jgi:hypothetical protein
MQARTLPERNIQITATIASSGDLTISNLRERYLAKPNTDDIINALRPSAGFYYTKNDSEEYNPIRKTYSRTVGWTIDASGILPSGTPSTSGLYPS